VLLLVDLDGVLTDGKVFVTSSGEKFKAFHSRDNRAIQELISNGWKIIVVTASSWPGALNYCRNLKVELQINRDKTKIKEIIGEQPYYAVGDDSWDINMLKNAVRSFCPCDADSSVLSIPGIHVLETKGGHGVMAELAKILIKE
jgi:3-deoxy-D-manno-octulosonate 8-phosphate phosphatase (KDO 8-P phosphatase)